MRLLRRFVPLAAIGIGGALACGGDSTGPKAASVTGLFGDNDSVLTGGTLSVGFTILNTQGFPLKGAKVSWTVAPVSAAAVDQPSQTTNIVANGASDTGATVHHTLAPFSGTPWVL